MKNIIRHYIFYFLLIIFAAACSASDKSSNLGYLSTANPASDLEGAKLQAAASKKKILIVAGGDWCRWCHVLDKFIADNEDVKVAMDKTFIVVKVYVGDEKMNEEFFAELPTAVGYPHFWVLSDKGELIKSVSTAGLEQGDDSYNKTEFLNFISD